MEWLLSNGFTRNEFRSRRARVAEIIGRDALALLQGAPRSTGMSAGLAQSKQFFYLTGVDIERSYALISGETGESTLFVPLDQVGGGHHQTATLTEETLPEFVKRVMAGERPEHIDLPGVLTPGVVPKNRARRSAVLGVTPRRRLTSSLTRWYGT